MALCACCEDLDDFDINMQIDYNELPYSDKFWRGENLSQLAQFA